MQLIIDIYYHLRLFYKKWEFIWYGNKWRQIFITANELMLIFEVKYDWILGL